MKKPWFGLEVLPRHGQGILNVLARAAALVQQPFTRSQSGIAIPASVKGVVLRAHDKQHG